MVIWTYLPARYSPKVSSRADTNDQDSAMLHIQVRRLRRAQCPVAIMIFPNLTITDPLMKKMGWESAKLHGSTFLDAPLKRCPPGVGNEYQKIEM